jgi:predicted nucleic acid-binding protein
LPPALRATHGTSISLPDALVIATAFVRGADRILTTDAGRPAVAVRVEALATA